MGAKRILHLTGMTCTKYGGIETYLLNLAYCARTFGFETILQYESLPAPRDYVADLAAAGIRLCIQPINSANVHGLYGIGSLLIKLRPQIVHTHFLSGVGALGVPILGRLCGTETAIAMVHNKPAEPGRLIKRLGWSLYDHVLCVSDSVRDSLHSVGINSRTLHTHYMGVFEQNKGGLLGKGELRKRLGISEGAICLACIAFDEYFKGWDMLLEALKEVVKAHADVCLIAVGVDPAVSQLPVQARTLGISGHIKWVGIVDNGADLLQAADIYVQPSRSSEGLPLSIMEAMSCKLPVVSTGISGNAEAVEDGITGIIVEPNSQELAKGILAMIDNRKQWEKMGVAARARHLKLFHGPSSVEQLVTQYYVT